MKRLLGFVFALVVASPIAVAEPVGPKLTPRLKNLLAEEMVQIARASADLSVAIATGDHRQVSELGIAVRDSFILKRSLTDQDKKDLMRAVPHEFIALDARFHVLAGKLAAAAEQKDSDLQVFYYARMLEACVSCHTKFASDRFPDALTNE